MEEQIMTLLGHARQQLGVGPFVDDWFGQVRSDVFRNEVNWVTKYDRNEMEWIKLEKLHLNILESK